MHWLLIKHPTVKSLQRLESNPEWQTAGDFVLRRYLIRVWAVSHM